MQADSPLASRNGSADIQFAEGNYAVALALYEQEAVRGDANACETAGYMLYFGPALFGPSVPCDRDRARRWLAVAAQSGHLFAQMLVRRIDGLDSLVRNFNFVFEQVSNDSPCQENR